MQDTTTTSRLQLALQGPALVPHRRSGCGLRAPSRRCQCCRCGMGRCCRRHCRRRCRRSCAPRRGRRRCGGYRRGAAAAADLRGPRSTHTGARPADVGSGFSDFSEQRLRPIGVVPHQLTRVRGLQASPPSPAVLEACAPCPRQRQLPPADRQVIGACASSSAASACWGSW